MVTRSIEAGPRSAFISKMNERYIICNNCQVTYPKGGECPNAKRYKMSNAFLNNIFCLRQFTDGRCSHPHCACPQMPSFDMVLHCWRCGVQHIDKEETQEDYVTRLMHQQEQEDKVITIRWTNPPHCSHLCAECGFIWRPADVATNGVAAIKTKGKSDSDPLIESFPKRFADLMTYVGFVEKKISAAEPFREAVTDALVVNHIYRIEHDSNARKALTELIVWETLIALDPKVSADAQALIERGRREADPPSPPLIPRPDHPISHRLKTWSEYFVEIVHGPKRFEIRLNDRDYRVGDSLILEEWEPSTNQFTGRSCTRIVAYMTNFNQRAGYVVMGIEARTNPRINA